VSSAVALLTAQVTCSGDRQEDILGDEPSGPVIGALAVIAEAFMNAALDRDVAVGGFLQPLGRLAADRRYGVVRDR